MTYTCLHCSRTFATPQGLKRHIFEKHQYDIDESEDEGAAIQMNESDLWDDEDKPYEEEPGLWDEDDFTMNDSKVISKPLFYSSYKS
jgi:hypothetical protein